MWGTLVGTVDVAWAPQLAVAGSAPVTTTIDATTPRISVMHFSFP
jgi:hypothetical protein